jgi:hypothetical protein
MEARRSPKLALLAIGVLALLAIVAFASRSGFGHQTDATPSPGYVSYAFTAFIILFLLSVPVALYALWVQARERETRRMSFQARVLANLITFAFVLGVVVGVLYLRRHHPHLFQRNDGKHHGAGNPLNHRPHGKLARYEPTFKWIELWIVLPLVAVGSAWAYYAYRRSRGAPRPRREPPSLADDLVAEIGDAIDDLEAEADARRAVIAAYARMEVVLSRNGLRRRASDTPLEYLRRILNGLTSRGDAVARLTSLFEQAKFSRHEISASMKLEAIGALREIRDDLQTAPA